MSQTGPPVDWPLLKRWIQAQHPHVRHIGPAGLAAHVQRRTGPSASQDIATSDKDSATADPAPMLIDIRSPAEQSIGSLPGAYRVQSVDEGLGLVHQLHSPGATIIACCSVGVRSARLCDALLQAGYNDALNLDGGLFAWVMAGLPLFNGSELVNVVHPFDERWATLLPAHLRAPLATAD